WNVMTDPRKLRPSELRRLLNSTPLGEVINERKLKRHRERAGLRIGDSRHVDLVRYVAWLVQIRHAAKPASEGMTPPTTAWAEAAEGAAALATRCNQSEGNRHKLTSKQEAVSSTVTALARLVGVGALLIGALPPPAASVVSLLAGRPPWPALWELARG